LPAAVRRPLSAAHVVGRLAAGRPSRPNS